MGEVTVGVKIGHDGIDVQKSLEKPNLGQNFKRRENEQPKRLAGELDRAKDRLAGERGQLSVDHSEPGPIP